MAMPRSATAQRRSALSPGTWLGDSEMARRVLAFDWSATPLGPLERWPASLRTIVWACLQESFQRALYWGPDLTCIYNDAERDVLGDLHPSALGMPALDLQGNAWATPEPQ